MLNTLVASVIAHQVLELTFPEYTSLSPCNFAIQSWKLLKSLPVILVDEKLKNILVLYSDSAQFQAFECIKRVRGMHGFAFYQIDSPFSAHWLLLVLYRLKDSSTCKSVCITTCTVH